MDGTEEDDEDDGQEERETIPSGMSRGGGFDPEKEMMERRRHRNKFRRVMQGLVEKFENQEEVYGITFGGLDCDGDDQGSTPSHILVLLNDENYASEIPDEIDKVPIEKKPVGNNRRSSPDFRVATIDQLRDWCEGRGMKIEESEMGFRAVESGEGQSLAVNVSDDEFCLDHGNRTLDLLVGCTVDLEEVAISDRVIRVGKMTIKSRR